MLKTIFTTRIIVIVCIIVGFDPVANAQTASPIFQDVTIDHKFSPDPLTVRGMSGGSISGDTIAGKKETPPTGLCKGFVDKDPDHTLKLMSKFDYLKLVVDSPADTTMIIKGPGGVWCNDDFDGKNPGIVGEWLPGAYQIWIGSYQEKEYLPYTLKITKVK
ncbi:MAG: hypothetical protein ACKO11_03975 [Cuspidothrix sp.]